MDSKQKPTLEWMYEGPSSSINREDYLTGKRIDKHYERSNADFQEPPSKLDFVIQNKTLSKDAPTSTSQRAAAASSSLLDLETIKKEDPLVAIKVREEKVRREILENPVKMKRLQKIVMKSMEKKMKKFLEQQRRRSGRSSDSDDSDSDRGRSSSRRHEQSERKDYRSHRRSSPDRRDRRDTDRSGSKSDRYKKSDDRSQHSRHRRSSDRSPIQRRSYRSRDHSNRSPPPPQLTRQRHDSGSSSASSETAQKAKRYAGYGLIHVKERKEAKSASSPKRESPKKKEPEKPSASSKSSKPQKPVWKPLSEEEMEKRRREMMENAKWRDEQRKRNLKRLAHEEEDQAKRDTKQRGEAVDFLRSMVVESTDHDSVEGRVKSKIQRLQRSGGAMESSFVRK